LRFSPEAVEKSADAICRLTPADTEVREAPSGGFNGMLVAIRRGGVAAGGEMPRPAAPSSGESDLSSEPRGVGFFSTKPSRRYKGSISRSQCGPQRFVSLHIRRHWRWRAPVETGVHWENERKNKARPLDRLVELLKTPDYSASGSSPPASASFEGPPRVERGASPRRSTGCWSSTARSCS